jgi:heptosyltransferase-3
MIERRAIYAISSRPRTAVCPAPTTTRERGNRNLRLIDRCVGIPLLLAISAFRRRRLRPAAPRVQRVGLLLFGMIGDSVLASATISDLRRHFPSARILCFITEGTRSISSIIDGVDDWAVVSVTRPDRSITVLRAHRVDILVDFGQWARITAILAAVAGARFTVGFRTVGQWRHFAYDAVADHSDQQHEIDNFRALTAALGIKSEGMPHLRRSPSLFRLDRRKRWVVLHPWAAGYRSELREWAQEKWVALAMSVLAWDYGIVITGGPSDRERAEALANAIGGQENAVMCVAGRTTLAESVSLLEQADAVVSVNTGLMHIAAALDRPLVALHGPTNPRRWGPVSKRAVVVGPGPEHGCGYLSLGHEYPAHPPDCMNRIEVEEVLAGLACCLGRDVDHSHRPTPAESKAVRPSSATVISVD